MSKYIESETHQQYIKHQMNHYYTYYIERKCLKCKKAIPDQAHGLIKFCEREVLPDGSIKSCKDDFNAAKRKKKMGPYKAIGYYHKLMHDRIEILLREKGELVSLDEILSYGINLTRAVESDYDQDEGDFIHYFVGYTFREYLEKEFLITVDNKYAT